MCIYSVHLYVFDCSHDDYGNQLEYNMAMSGQLSCPNRHQIDFIKETVFYNCTRPVYMTNLINIISFNTYQPLPPIIDIWKSLDTNVWYFIISSLFVFIIINKLRDKYQYSKHKNYSVFTYLWIYFKPLLGIHEHRVFNYLYISWIICLIPLTEILRNKLLANLVTRPFINLHTIDDILDDRVDVYTDPYTYGQLNSTGFIKSLHNNTFNAKLLQLVRYKLKRFESPDSIQDNLKYLDHTDLIYDKMKYTVLVVDEILGDIGYPYAARIASVHSGQSYLPALITALCYAPQFTFINETNIM